MPKKRGEDFSQSNFPTSLERWLSSRGLNSNPFERWNAENDLELPTYFVDIGNIDEFSQLKMPSIIFAQRGCGKTAQKQMVATECRPLKNNSIRLSITYTYNSFERVLKSVDYDIDRVRPQHHVNALLYLGLNALDSEIKKDEKLQKIVKSPTFAFPWNAYISHFASPLLSLSTAPSPIDLDKLSSVELLQGFAFLLNELGLEACVVLVDGLDEFISTSDPSQAIKFLAPLLGTLSIIECSGFAFKFFLPKELESIVFSCNWFRQDRIQIIPIEWKPKELLQLIEHRLIYFSRREPKYSDLAELCDDELGAIIDKEIILLAGSLPRHILIMADRLLRFHCDESSPPELIKLETWTRVKDWWSSSHEKTHLATKTSTTADNFDEGTNPLSKGDFTYPSLHVDEAKGTVKLGKQEIRSKFKGKIYSMLLYLYKHKDEVCNKNMIVENVWPDVEVGDYVTDQVIAANISRLRRILSEISPGREYVETIKGKTRSEGGYRLSPNGFNKDAA